MHRFEKPIIKINKRFLAVFISIILLLEFVFVTFMFNLSIPAGFVFTLIFLVLDAMFWITFGESNIYKNITFASLALLVIGTGGTYSLLYNLRISKDISESAKIGTISDWIGYSGSIIGGSMTMFALIFTIQNEDMKRKREELLRIMPFIKIEPILANQELIDLTKPIIIRNVSHYPLRYLNIEEVYLEVNQDYPESVNFNVNDLPVFLPGGETYTPTFSQDLIDYLSEIKEGQIYLRLKFEYFDQLKAKKYGHTMILELDYYSNSVIFSEIKNVFTPE